MSNPNNPSGLSWNGSAIPVGYNLSDYNYPQAGNNVLRAFNLPDQIDGMDYKQSFFVDAACCKENNVYDVSDDNQNEEQAVSATWSNGNNPFNNTSNAVFLQDVNDVAISSSSCQSVVSAKVLKARIGLSPKYNEFIEMVDISTGPNSRMAQNEQEEKEVNSLNKINVYPNPTKEQFTITHNIALELGNVLLEIYDIMGKNVLQQAINAKENIVNINTLKSGIYFYSIKQNSRTIKKDKLIVR